VYIVKYVLSLQAFCMAPGPDDPAGVKSICRECGAHYLPCCPDTQPGEVGSCTSGCSRGGPLSNYPFPANPTCSSLDRAAIGAGPDDDLTTFPEAITTAICVAGSDGGPAMCELCGQLDQPCCAPGTCPWAASDAAAARPFYSNCQNMHITFARNK
jgi:hypothetical protein